MAKERTSATDRDERWEPRKYAVEAPGGPYARGIYEVECAAVARYAFRRDNNIRAHIALRVTLVPE